MRVRLDVRYTYNIYIYIYAAPGGASLSMQREISTQSMDETQPYLRQK